MENYTNLEALDVKPQQDQFHTFAIQKPMTQPDYAPSPTQTKHDSMNGDLPGFLQSPKNSKLEMYQKSSE